VTLHSSPVPGTSLALLTILCCTLLVVTKKVNGTHTLSAEMIRSFKCVDRRLPAAVTTAVTSVATTISTSAVHLNYLRPPRQDRKKMNRHFSVGNFDKLLISRTGYFAQERKKETRFTVSTSKLYILLLVCSGCFVVSSFWNHLQRELPSKPSKKPQKEKKVKIEIPVVFHGLDTFIPLKNASTTFTLDNFHFILLHDRVPVKATDSHLSSKSQSQSLSAAVKKNKALEKFQWRWTVPNITDDSNHMPTSMLQSTTNRTNFIYHLNICQVVCQFDEVSFAIVHFPHFLQQALPCYSIFHYMGSMIRRGRPTYPPQSSEYFLRNYMVLPGNGREGKFSPYIQNVIRVMEGPPFYVHMIYGFNESIPVHEDCPAMPVTKHQPPPYSDKVLSSVTTSPNALLAIKAFVDTGWDTPNRYFLSSNATVEHINDALPVQPNYDNYELIQQIQQSVLGADQYHAGPSLFDRNDQMLQVLILDRKSSSRDFVHVDDTIRVLRDYKFNYNGVMAEGSSDNTILNTSQKTEANNIHSTTTTTTTQFRLNVTYVSSFIGHTLYEQAYLMHHADIIYSPHGAQLANLIYIRPCTVLVEFFPRAYYVQFFQPLALSAKGISYEGYPTSTINFTDKVADSLLTSQNYEVQKVVRKARINVQSEFFLRTLPELIGATIQCRSNYYRKM
jgi:Glycosyltransferase 61